MKSYLPLIMLSIIRISDASGMIAEFPTTSFEIFVPTSPILISDIKIAKQIDQSVLEDSKLTDELNNFCQHLNVRIKQLNEEKQTAWAIAVDSKVKNLAAQLGSLEASSPHIGAEMWKIMNPFVDFCKKCPSEALKIIRETTDFNFCWGIVAYYVTNGEGFKELNENFLKFFQKQMTKENGLELLRNSDGENAYFFLQSLENDK